MASLADKASPEPGHASEQADWTVTIRPTHKAQSAKTRLMTKHLDILDRILSHVEDPADLARICRANRAIRYMCIPHLYSDVSLVHHSSVRISKETGLPVGCGGATPFFMGLNALVTTEVVNAVKSLEIQGEWRKKHDVAARAEDEESARLGIVPDSNMMLSLLVRRAVERCLNLNRFSWRLDTKMLPTVWAGLSQKQTLTELVVRMPNSRAPMPAIDAPPIPNLRCLSVYDIDPLCYPDSLSTLLFGSKKLEHLKLHWSPRMRKEREPSTNIQAYFGECLSAKYAMQLKSFAMQNLYSISGGDFGGIVDPSTVESYCLLSSMPGENDTADMAFVGYNWQWAPPSPLRMPNLKRLRGDKVSKRHAVVLGAFNGLEQYYLVSGRRLQDRAFDGRASDSASFPDGASGTSDAVRRKSESVHTGSSDADGSDLATPASPPEDRSSDGDIYNHESPHSINVRPSVQGERAIALLGPTYLDSIVNRHAATIKELLLLPNWRFTPEEVVRLVRSAPGLEQLGIGIDVTGFVSLAAKQQQMAGSGPAGTRGPNPSANGSPVLTADAFKGNLLGLFLRLVQPYARRLRVLRLLDSPGESDISDEVLRAGGDERMEQRIARQSWGREFDGLRWVGLGDYVFEIRNQGSGAGAIEKGGGTPSDGTNVRRVRRRPVRMVTTRRSGIRVYTMDELKLDV